MRRRKMLSLTIKILLASIVMLIIYLCMRSKSRETVPKPKIARKMKIFIVEKEVDVISMLYNLTEEIRFSSTSGTLISISSHFTNGLNLLSKQEANNYLTMNDINTVQEINVETLSAAITGLFEKIIWIYPMWIPNSNIFTKNRQMLGVTTNNQMCICNIANNNSYSNVSFCQNLFPIVMGSTDDADCQLINNYWEMLSMQEIYALVSLGDTALTSPIVVNINLDFFTSEHPAPLSIDRVLQNQIEAHLNRLFCTRSLLEESLVDAWFHRFMEHRPAVSVDQLGEITEMPMDIACQSTSSFVKNGIEMLITELAKLTETQLKELMTVGVCIVDSASRERTTDGVHKLELCNGFAHSNRSTSSSSPMGRHTHSCADVEFHLQMEKIAKILGDSIKQPTIISIVRSSRTGVVSHRNQNYMEKRLLSKLKSIYKIQSSDVIYNDNLLGGAKGWWQRHRQKSSNIKTAHLIISDIQ